MDVEVNDRFLRALGALLQVLVRNFGAWCTIGLVGVALLALFGFRFYKDVLADRAIERALAEKEKSIQRLANQERTWRRLFLTEVLKADPAEVDKILLLEGDYADAREARKAIESRKKK